MENRKQEVKCPHCGHRFPTRSELILVTCGSCGKKFRKDKNLIKPKDQKEL